jgi:hypothetical protein
MPKANAVILDNMIPFGGNGELRAASSSNAPGPPIRWRR